MQDKARDIVSLLDFGGNALRSGTVDASAAINAALTAHQAVMLPTGQYRIDGPIVYPGSGRSLYGIDLSGVILLVNFTTGDVITADAGAGASLTKCMLGNVQIFSLVTRTTGYAVNFRKTSASRIEHIIIDGPQAGGVKIDGAAGTQFDNRLIDYRISSCSLPAVYITGYARDTHLLGGLVGGSPTSLQIDDASGVYGANVDNSAAVGGTAPGILINPKSTQNVNALFFNNFLSDLPGGDAWLFSAGPDATEGKITEVFIANGWGCGSAAGAGLRTTTGGLDGLTLTNFHAHHNWQHGISIEAGNNIHLGSGTSALMNSVAGSALYDGILIGANADNVSISDATAGKGGYMDVAAGLPSLQRYGINAGSPSVTNDPRKITIGPCKLPGNVTGPFSIPSGPKITVAGVEEVFFVTPAAIAGGTTIYVGASGITGGEAGAQYYMPRAGTLRGLRVASTSAPGVGEAYTVIVRVNSVATTAVVTLSGAAAFAGGWAGDIAYAAGASISIQIVTSAGAAATQLRGSWATLSGALLP